MQTVNEMSEIKILHNPPLGDGGSPPLGDGGIIQNNLDYTLFSWS